MALCSLAAKPAPSWSSRPINEQLRTPRPCLNKIRHPNHRRNRSSPLLRRRRLRPNLNPGPSLLDGAYPVRFYLFGLFALLRNEGGSFGTSVAQTIVERREQLHTLRLNENLDPLNPAVTSFTEQAQPGFLQIASDPVAAQQMTLQALENTRDQQALSLSYFDCFWIFGVTGVLLSFLVPLMRRSVVEKGAHLAAE